MNISNENRLLLFCAQAKISENQLSQVNSLVSLALDWDRILGAAFSQSIAPLLYNSLKHIQGLHCIPRKVMDKLQSAYHGNLARNMYLYAELLSILNVFDDQGVRVIVLKGATLAKIVYGDIGLRPMIDIDLLVKQEDLDRAQEIMSGLNYVPESNVRSEEWYRENHHHLPPYIHREKPVVVEIHRHITGKSFCLNIEKWWERAGNTNLNGCNVMLPSPEDMLIHLCLHLYNHGYDSKMILREVCDICETLNYYREEINWPLFHNEITQCRLQKPVYSVLSLVKKFCEYTERSLPSQLLKSSYHVDIKLVKILEKRMFAEDEAFSAIPGGLVKSLVVDTFWEKMRLLRPTVFPPREVISKRYAVRSSSNKVYFYFLIRPFRLFLKYGKHLFTISRIKVKKNEVV